MDYSLEERLEKTIRFGEIKTCWYLLAYDRAINMEDPYAFVDPVDEEFFVPEILRTHLKSIDAKRKASWDPEVAEGESEKTVFYVSRSFHTS